ncbi:diguanylate cyclase/phosphodiesterase (GGDEF & EAL domains) [Sulfurimonas gotlandica GD1]|uniref:Diguanylate cyclase/phosphodiesterase (GGDEF & EAL domains) n=1 Tax=Sulfurimonas gotlandica (strain DSM 19862 / JCM 16533 / GD1) TaxID=929558 RepID=B6BMP9_SULGG|nr:EAL domain-containing protein [Sulfurimonas gotlandica]EDZ61583.1 diguanylate cyclase/phosphodiesterase [Sulfurimonas gotlandica GD1]EHP30834.1 diguanylate cyclase/phosphodiesterase (GGDEF & EAL domains) [Sulfurimonas gotlandica GD1]
MNIPEKTKQKTLLLSITVLLVSWVVGYIFLDYQFKNSVDEQLENITESTEKLFEIKVREEDKTIKFRLARIVSADGLSKAIAEADYEKIHSIITPYFNRLKSLNEDVKILTFRSPDGVTLYRAHKPEFRGDTLNNKRKLILDTNTMQRSFSGFEVGKLEMTYRTTQAIFYKNIYVGNVELGVSPELFIKDLNTIFNIDIGIAIDKSLLDIMLNNDKISINDTYTLIKGSEKLRKFFTSPKELSDFRVDMNMPLQNHLSKTLGILVVGFDISKIVEQNRAFMYKLLFIGIFVALLLVIVLHEGFNMMLKHFTKQVYTDHLTGLSNRQALNDALYSGESNVLILSNIKEFSLLNELYGVDVGNEVLLQVAHEFEKFGVEHGFNSYRVSSDEYVLLKEDSNFEAEVYSDFLDELHNNISTLPIYIGKIEETLRVEIYSGLAFDHEHSLEEAQMALRKAKEKSLPYLAYSQSVDTKKNSERILGMKRVIRHALEHKNVIPFFQPITDKNGNIIKYEALVRIVDFENGEKSIIFPDDFLPVAIKSGLYIEVAQEMLSQALSFFSDRDEKISVNFLPNDFFNYALMDKLVTLISKFKTSGKIVIEITEQEGIEDFDRLVRVVERLRKQGVLIAIDDFGSGYANYAHILRIKPDYLKIDGSLIKNILNDNDSKILVKSIIRFAKDLETKTIAEYVENEEIFELLKEYGVDEFQGYYFGRPTDLINS